MNEEIGTRIRELRQQKGYAGIQIAKEIGVSPKYIFELERGMKRFSVEVLLKMSELFDVSCDYILFGEEIKKHKKC